MTSTDKFLEIIELKQKLVEIVSLEEKLGIHQALMDKQIDTLIDEIDRIRAQRKVYAHQREVLQYAINQLHGCDQGYSGEFEGKTDNKRSEL